MCKYIYLMVTGWVYKCIHSGELVYEKPHNIGNFKSYKCCSYINTIHKIQKLY